MPTVSGTVRNVITNSGIAGADIHSLASDKFLFFDSVVSSVGGAFSITVPSGGQAIYVPYKNGYQGFKRQLPVSTTGFNLYLRTADRVFPTNSGVAFTALVGAPITTSTEIADFKSTPCHLLVATSRGLDIIEADTKENVAYVVRSGGYTALHVDPDKCSELDVYLGTSSDGLFTLEFGEFIGNLGLYVHPSFSLPDDDIRAIHGNSLEQLLVGTSGGVHLVSSSGTFSHITPVPVETCFLTKESDLYYSPTGSGVYVKYAPLSGPWTVPDYVLKTSTTPGLLSNLITDIEVVTTVSGNNHVFLATSSGIVSYEENRSNISSSPYRTFSSVIDSSTLFVTGVKTVGDPLYNSGQIVFSTFNNEAGSVKTLDLATSGIVTHHNVLSFETNLRRSGLTTSGSRFVNRRDS